MGRDGHRGVGERSYKNTLLGGVGMLVLLIVAMVLWFVCIQKLKKLYIILNQSSSSSLKDTKLNLRNQSFIDFCVNSYAKLTY